MSKLTEDQLALLRRPVLAHIDALAKKYLDADTYPFRQPDEERVIVRVNLE